jgi:tetratricopeptide (TPR) repeat protein
MPSRPQPPENKENPGNGDRLDGWKAIASYLDRSERTVKRWEATRGLPTHRIPGQGKRAVFAWAGELDEWLRSSGGEDDAESADTGGFGPENVESEAASEAVVPDNALTGTEPSEPPSLPAHRPLPWRLLAVAALVLICLAAILVSFSSSRKLHARVSTAPTAPAPDGGAGPNPSASSETAIARNLYLQGRYEWNQRTPDSLNRALDSFTQAIVHDPTYAEAYVGLAETYALLREYSTMPDNEAFSRSLAAAKKAVELDDSLSEAHRALAFAEMYGTWEFADAEKEFRRAIELDPKDPLARHWYANAFGMPGRFDECLHQMEIAQSLDPTSHATLADKGWMLFLAGKRDEGVKTLIEVERSVPDFVSPHSYLMQIGLEVRDYPLFLEEGEKMAAARQDPSWRQLLAAARRGYARSGERGLLQAMHDAARGMPSSYASSTTMAKICILLGRKEEALQVLEEQYSHHDSNVFACLSHPILLTLKDEPRYQALVHKINFPPPAVGAAAGS